MPKKIDPSVKARCVHKLLDYAAEKPNVIVEAQAASKHYGVHAESVRRWYFKAQVDTGQHIGASGAELI